jgi:quercetin dioxygenase-like cupin family protein
MQPAEASGCFEIVSKENVMTKTAFGLPMVLLLCVGGSLAGCSQDDGIGKLEPRKAGKIAPGPKGVIRGRDAAVTETPWGSLQWLVSGNGGTSEEMTLGRVTFKPGQANPPHSHPNCEEVLFVVSGEIEHTLPGGGTTVLKPGDAIVLERGVKHHAKNVGTQEAVVLVAFNSAYRKTVGE